MLHTTKSTHDYTLPYRQLKVRFSKMIEGHSILKEKFIEGLYDVSKISLCLRFKALVPSKSR